MTLDGSKKFAEIWDSDRVKLGFEKFYTEFGRYPTAHEVDEYVHLPSSRQIQRKYGGLIEVRKSLGLSVLNYGSGKTRSAMAIELSKKGIQAENRLEEKLINFFGEHYVHIEKPLYKYFDLGKAITLQFKKKARADFVVFYNGGVFAVDVFVAKDIHSLQRTVSIKANKYSGLSIPMFFVHSGNSLHIPSIKIERLINNKTRKLDANIEVLNEKDFMEYCTKLGRIEH